jgi:hypothetical protein
LIIIESIVSGTEVISIRRDDAYRPRKKAARPKELRRSRDSGFKGHSYLNIYINSTTRLTFHGFS